MPLLDNFVANLKAAIKKAGISQRELARRSNVHYVTINRIIQGNLDPSIQVCEALGKAAGMTEEKIFRVPAKT